MDEALVIFGVAVAAALALAAKYARQYLLYLQDKHEVEMKRQARRDRRAALLKQRAAQRAATREKYAQNKENLASAASSARAPATPPPKPAAPGPTAPPKPAAAKSAPSKTP